MSLVAAARTEECECFCVLFLLVSLSCQQIIIQVFDTTLVDRATQNTSHIGRQSSSPESECVMLEWIERIAASGMPLDHQAVRDLVKSCDQHDTILR